MRSKPASKKPPSEPSDAPVTGSRTGPLPGAVTSSAGDTLSGALASAAPVEGSKSGSSSRASPDAGAAPTGDTSICDDDDDDPEASARVPLIPGQTLPSCDYDTIRILSYRVTSGGQHPLRPRRGGTSIKGSWPGGPGGGAPGGKIADFFTFTRIFHARRRRGPYSNRYNTLYLGLGRSSLPKYQRGTGPSTKVHSKQRSGRALGTSVTVQPRLRGKVKVQDSSVLAPGPGAA